MVLLIVVIVLTGLVVVLGIQVYYILRDFRTTVGKTNKILDDVSSISGSMSSTVDHFSSFGSGFKMISSLFSLVSLFKKKMKDDRTS